MFHKPNNRHKALSIETKLAILQRIRSNVPYCNITEEFHVSKLTISEIKKNGSKLIELSENGIDVKKKRFKFSGDGEAIDQVIRDLFSFFFLMNLFYRLYLNGSLKLEEEIYQYLEHFCKKRLWK